MTRTPQTADLGVRDSKCIFCTKLKMCSFPMEPKVRDGPGLPRDHSHLPESQKMETIGLMEWSFVVMVAGDKQMDTQSQHNNLSFGSHRMWPVSQLHVTPTASSFIY